MTELIISAEEATLIEAALRNDAVKPWDDVALAGLRSRIKKLRIAQQKRRCCYCRQRFNTAHGRAWDLDHVLYQVKYPQFSYEPENLAVACIDCNQAKAVYDALAPGRSSMRLPRSSKAYTLCHPHFDQYDQHILIQFDYLYTPTGLKGIETIKACKLYRFANARHQVDAGPSGNAARKIVDRLTRSMATGAGESDVILALFETQAIATRAIASHLDAD
jgi:5-methylcytosine-specific restriction endonuclease McrA